MIKKVLSVMFVVVVLFGMMSAAAHAELKIGMVYDIGGRGDQSFNDSAYRGLQWASELGVKYVDIEPGAAADRESGLRMIASQGFDLVIGVGFLFTDAINAVADEFPDTKFAIVDGFIPDKPNVSSLLFVEQDGSFLVGVIAGMKAKADGKDQQEGNQEKDDQPKEAGGDQGKQTPGLSPGTGFGLHRCPLPREQPGRFRLPMEIDPRANREPHRVTDPHVLLAHGHDGFLGQPHQVARVGPGVDDLLGDCGAEEIDHLGRAGG